MLKISFILFFSLLAIVGKSQITDSSNYVIYSFIINANIPKDKKSVAVFNMTSREEYYNPWYGDTINRAQLISTWFSVFRTPFDSSAYVLYKDFDKKYQKAEKLSNSFQLPIEIFLIKKSLFKNLFKTSVPKGWGKFYKQYPNSAGVFEFSDVHYSEDKTKAIVYYAIRRNGLNGGGSIIILDKIGGQWKPIHEATLWAN